MPTSRRQLRARKASRRTIAPLIEVTRSGTAGAKEDAAAALASLAEDSHENQVAIAAEGGIAPLVELTRSGTTGATKEQAVRVLCNLTFYNDDNKVAIVAEGGIAPLVELTRSGTAVAKEEAARALCSLAINNEDNRVAIAAEGAIAPLIELTRSGTAAAKEAAVGVLADLAGNDHFAILAEGGIVPLVEVARSGTARAKKWAVLALRILACKNPDCQAAIVRAGGREALEALARHGDMEARQGAAAALRNLPAEAVTDPSLACLSCGKAPEGGRLWSRCKGCIKFNLPTTYYCGEACMMAHWPQHKEKHTAAKAAMRTHEKAERDTAVEAAAEEARVAAEAAQAERAAAEELLRRCLRGWRAEAERAGRQRRHDKLMLEEEAATREREAARKRRAEAERAEREANPTTRSKYVVPKGPAAPKAGVDRAAVRSIEEELEHATYTSEEARLQRNLHGIRSQVMAASEADEQREAKKAAARRQKVAERKIN